MDLKENTLSQEIDDNTKVNQVQQSLDGKGRVLHCVDCKHSHRWNNSSTDSASVFCKKSRELKVEYLIGPAYGCMDTCYTMRGSETLCGRQGKYWESKD